MENKKLDELTISDVIQMPEYYKEVNNTLAGLRKSRYEASIKHNLKAHPIDSLERKGILADTGKFIVLYAEICERKAKELSSNERNFIKMVGLHAFNNVMKKLVEDEKKGNAVDRND